MNVELHLSCVSGVRIIDLACSEEAKKVGEGGEVTLVVHLKAFQLRSFAITSEGASIKAVRVSVEGDLPNMLRARLDEVCRGVDSSSPVVVEAKRSLEKHQYVRALHLLESYYVKSLLAEARQKK